MSLPSIKELIVDLKDLGNYVQTTKGVFPFVLNEKATTSPFEFKQKWMDTLNFDEAYLSDLEKKGLLAYNEFDDKPSVEKVNELTEESPTELGDEAANIFRKGIEGVFRVMSKNAIILNSMVESNALHHKDLYSFGNDTFLAKQNPHFASGKQLFEIISKPLFENNVQKFAQEFVQEVFPLIEVIDNTEVEKPFGHRLHNPQQVILNDDDIDLARFFELFDDEGLDALLDDTTMEQEPLQPVVDEPALDKPVIDNEVDHEAVAALLEGFDEDTMEALLADYDQNEEDNADKIATEKTIIVPEVLPAVDKPVLDEDKVDYEQVNALLEGFDVDDLELPPLLQTDAQDDDVVELPPFPPTETVAQDDVVVELPPFLPTEMLAQDDVVVELPPFLPTETLAQDDVVGELPPFSQTTQPEEIVDNEAVNALLADFDMDEFEGEQNVVVADKQEESFDLPPPLLTSSIDHDEVNALLEGFDFDSLELPLPQVAPLETKVEAPKSMVVPAETALIVDDKAVDTLLDNFNVDNDTVLLESTTTEQIDTTAVDELLNMVTQEVPVAPMNPPPVPTKSMAQWQAEKAQQAKQTPVSETTQASESTTVTKPKNFHADKPAFQIQAGDFVAQWQKIKENKSKKATDGATDATEQKTLPVADAAEKTMLDVFKDAIKNAKKAGTLKESAESTETDEDSLDDWDLDDIRDDNKFLIRQNANEAARGTDIQAKVNQLLEGKSDALIELVDSFEHKAKGLAIFSKLSDAAQENTALVDAITDGINSMQRVLVSDIKAYATSSMMNVMENLIVEKMNTQFDVDHASKALTAETVKSAISTLLASPSPEMINSIEHAATQAIDELLSADRHYFENGAVPNTGFCKTAVEHISQGLEALKPKLSKIIEAEGLAETTAESVKSAGWGEFFTNAIFGRRKAYADDTQDDAQDDADEFSDSDEESSKEDAKLDTSEKVEQTDPSQSANPFSMAGIKNMLGNLFGGGHAATKEKAAVQSDSEVDIDAVNELLADMSPMSSDYFTPVANTPIEMSEVFTADPIPGIEGNSEHASVISPVIAQQLLTETHDSANGSIFG